MFKYFLTFCLFSYLHADIIIRHARVDELEDIVNLDREISWEYFKPLFLEYIGLPLAENPDKMLEDELVPDRDMFINGINQSDGHRLSVAADNNRIVGFISFNKKNTTLTIDLLMVHKSYRNQKLGKRLLETALNSFTDIHSCTLLVLDKNIAARRFYESYGFVPQEVPEDIQSHLPVYHYIYLFYKKIINYSYELNQIKQ